MVFIKKQLALLKSEIHKWINSKENFGGLPKIEQTKYLAFFAVNILHVRNFSAQDIGPLFLEAGVSTPENVRDLLNKLKSKGALISAGNEFSFHRDTVKELNQEFTHLLASGKSSPSQLQGEKEDLFKLLKIHPEIVKSSKELFEDGHYAQAIFEAFKKVNILVKAKSGRTDLDGKSLMQQVFSVNNPILKFNELRSIADKDEQEGFMHLFAGAIQGIRNPKGHEEIIQRDPVRTIEYLSFASLLCKRLEETTR